MRILQFGGTGVLGRAIALEAVKRGHEVVTVADQSGPFPPVSGVAKHLMVSRDDDTALRAAFACLPEDVQWDLVIDGICYNERQAALLHALIAGRTSRLIVITSTIVYAADQIQPISENGRLVPSREAGEYGAGKLDIERYWASRSSSSGIDVTIFRLPHILGAGAELGPVPLHNRDAQLLARLRNEQPLYLVDGGRQLLQVVFSEDVAGAIFAAVDAPRTFGALYNCCNPELVVARNYYAEIARLLGRELRVVGIEYEALERSSWGWLPTARSRVFSSEKLREDTGYICTTPFLTSVQRTVEHLLGSGREASPAHELALEGLASTGRAELAEELSRLAATRSRSSVDQRMNR